MSNRKSTEKDSTRIGSSKEKYKYSSYDQHEITHESNKIKDPEYDPNMPNSMGYMGSTTPLFPSNKRSKVLVSFIILFFIGLFLLRLFF